MNENINPQSRPLPDAIQVHADPLPDLAKRSIMTLGVVHAEGKTAGMARYLLATPAREVADEMLAVLEECVTAWRNLYERECYDSGTHPCVCTPCKVKAAIAKAREK